MVPGLPAPFPQINHMIFALNKSKSPGRMEALVRTKFLDINRRKIGQIFNFLHVQQVPNPEAQLPALTPPLLEHSSL